MAVNPEGGMSVIPGVGRGRVLVTSGPTRAWLDRIRYIANTSTGALGAGIVDNLLDAGIDVVHVIGPGAERPAGRGAGSYNPRPVETVDDLIGAVRDICAGGIAAVVHAMAVLDYVPAERCGQKRKSGGGDWTVRLVQTPKVSEIIRGLAPAAFFVGFKLEAGVDDGELERRAMRSLRAHGLDLVVANDLDRVSGDRHEAMIFDSGGTLVASAETKSELAAAVAGLVAQELTKRGGG